MESLIIQLKLFLSYAIPVVAGFGVGSIWLWLRGVKAEQKRNAFNELNNTQTKIHLDINAKPIDDLLSDSNRSHGVKLGRQAGVGTKEE